MPFHYYADRQSPWLLGRQMTCDAPVAELRRTAVDKLLSRPALRRLVGGCGGLLRRADVMALAHAERFDGLDDLGRAGLAALEEIWALDWRGFELTFTDWGSGPEWRWAQISRQGGSLVIQLGFPADHAALMGRFLPQDARQKFEESYHPVNLKGRPTLAWARVDMDLTSGEALIEEVQCDWLRLVAEEVAWLAEAEPRSRQSRAHQAYQRALFGQYAKLWPQAMLLAALEVLEILGARRVWMHMPEPGATLKGIDGLWPPQSLYSRLPKSFCFQPVAELPALLRPRPLRRSPRFARERLKQVAAMARIGRPVFWRLDLS
jgi:hypothetical protein